MSEEKLFEEVKVIEAKAKSLGEEGASMVEYALLLALVAVIAIIALTFLGEKVSGQFSKIGQTLS